jgi:predicted AlkP superfamily phosphohydrolase/phosphomutase
MLGRFFKKEKEKVAVLGIDGVPFSLLKSFIEKGLMPNLEKIIQRGTFAPMTASIPEVSSTSWSTFMTGMNPGKHNIYGFTELHKNSYKWRFPNSDDIKSDTLWDIAGRNNKKSIVMNVPSTYPAKELNGILTAGFVALDLKKATYPQTAYEYLKNIGYRMDVDTQKAQESPEALAENIDKTFEIRKNAILYFMDNHEWNLFIAVVTETDRLHHYLWNALDDKKHSLHNFFQEFYRKVDLFIGEMYSRTGDDMPFIILSDHGFTAIKKEIYLNTWLKEKGYLKFNNGNPQSFEDMHEDSRIFALDPARFYIHLKGKYPCGSVDMKDYEGLRHKLKDELLSFTIDGEKIIKTVKFKEELYNGDFFEQAPDLIALSNDGYDLKGSINKTAVAGRGLLTGGHTRENAVFFINRKVNAVDVNIMDVGPTIISLLGIKDIAFDGRCLVDR